MTKIELLKKLYKHTIEWCYHPEKRILFELTTIHYNTGIKKEYVSDQTYLDFHEYGIRAVLEVTKDLRKRSINN
jgi:hypothetical protein